MILDVLYDSADPAAYDIVVIVPMYIIIVAVTMPLVTFSPVWNIGARIKFQPKPSDPSGARSDCGAIPMNTKSPIASSMMIAIPKHHSGCKNGDLLRLSCFVSSFVMLSFCMFTPIAAAKENERLNITTTKTCIVGWVGCL